MTRLKHICAIVVQSSVRRVLAKAYVGYLLRQKRLTESTALSVKAAEQETQSASPGPKDRKVTRLQVICAVIIQACMRRVLAKMQAEGLRTQQATIEPSFEENYKVSGAGGSPDEKKISNVFLKKLRAMMHQLDVLKKISNDLLEETDSNDASTSDTGDLEEKKQREEAVIDHEVQEDTSRVEGREKSKRGDASAASEFTCSDTEEPQQIEEVSIDIEVPEDSSSVEERKKSKRSDGSTASELTCSDTDEPQQVEEAAIDNEVQEDTSRVEERKKSKKSGDSTSSENACGDTEKPQQVEEAVISGEMQEDISGVEERKKCKRSDASTASELTCSETEESQQVEEVAINNKLQKDTSSVEESEKSKRCDASSSSELTCSDTEEPQHVVQATTNNEVHDNAPNNVDKREELQYEIIQPDCHSEAHPKPKTTGFHGTVLKQLIEYLAPMAEVDHKSFQIDTTMADLSSKVGISAGITSVSSGETVSTTVSNADTNSSQEIRVRRLVKGSFKHVLDTNQTVSNLIIMDDFNVPALGKVETSELDALVFQWELDMRRRVIGAYSALVNRIQESQDAAWAGLKAIDGDLLRLVFTLVFVGMMLYLAFSDASEDIMSAVFRPSSIRPLRLVLRTN
jgi:hypothetical protein